ncbi:Protein FAM210B [Carex littledalei]|uniref:Protein FAM210B n=1 Tax=Carex littledalei TaxID=544730 RepID=A0A833REB4_9POAL|nr:Protein FAM210B [Carex littledalei]
MRGVWLESPEITLSRVAVYPFQKVAVDAPFVHLSTSEWCYMSLPPSSHLIHPDPKRPKPNLLRFRLQPSISSSLSGDSGQPPKPQTANRPPFEVRTKRPQFGFGLILHPAQISKEPNTESILFTPSLSARSLAVLSSLPSSTPMASRALLLSTVLPSSGQRLFHTKQANQLNPLFPSTRVNGKRVKLQAVQETKEEAKASPSPEEMTEKFGLEYGLWKIFSSKEKDAEGKEKSKTDQAKELLAKYGGAYLATSITLSIISFGLCYFLVTAGIDVHSLLSKIGITTDETGGKVGTFALAYAAHKAASPIRFPPTVALTPIVANWIGKKATKDEK